MAQSQYATSAQLQALTITPAAAARFGAAAITATLQEASSIADAYLASQFTLPLVISPQGWDMSLTGAVCSITAYLLYKRTGFAPSAPGDDIIGPAYKAALDWLTQVSKKEIFPQFVDSAGGTPATPEQGPFVVSDTPVGFTSRGVTSPPAFDPFWGLG